MKAYLIMNTLFKTVEYKIDSFNNLKITEFSLSGINSNIIDINNLKTKEHVSTTSNFSWLILTIGLIAIISAYFFKNTLPIINNNLMSIMLFISTICGALFLMCKPENHITYIDTLSNKAILKLTDKSIEDHSAKQFLSELNNAIKQCTINELELSDLSTNAQKEFEMHDKNVTDLFNSGMIDEVLYKRICKSMRGKAFNTENNEELIRNDNVIYLNQ